MTGILILLGACEGSEYDLSNTIPNEFHKILYMKDGGKKDLTLYRGTGQAKHYTFSVTKAGSNPNLEAKVEIKLMTQEQVDEHGDLDGVTYKIIDESTYSLDVTHLDFATTEIYKKVDISLDPEKISAVMESDPSAMWVLPLQVTSETDSINTNKKELFLRLEVRDASIGFATSGLVKKEYSYSSLQNIKENAIFKLDVENVWNINCEFGVDEEFLTEYNSLNGTSYELLPEETYSFAETMPLSVTEAALTINVEGEKLKALVEDDLSGEYMLPIRIKNVDKFTVSPTNAVYALAIHITPNLDRTGWTVTASSEELNGSNSGKGEGPAIGMLDGNSSTFWENQWKADPAPKPTLPFTLIIDTQTEHTFIKFLMQQRNHPNKDTKGGTFHVSSDKENWTQVGTFDNLGKNTSVQGFAITKTKGRYIKITVTSSYGTGAQLAEFYAHGK